MLKSIIPLLIATVTVFTFQNCAGPYDVSDNKPKVIYVTDATFTSYIQEFESHARQSVSSVPIAFADLGDKYAGMCYRTIIAGQLVYAYIEINREYWPKMSELQKINLIFHELGHCFLQRGHVQSDNVRTCPTSFMDDTVMSTSCLRDNFDSYIKEMFP
jgi:hypothetical protein